MTRRLVLCDLDHTLITNEFTMTTDTLPAAIQVLQSRGILVGLNSDRPFHTLQKHAEQLGMQGPVVCERGNVIHCGEEILFERTHLKNIMHQVRLQFIDLINKKEPLVNLLVGDSEKLYHPMKALPISQTSGWFVLLNKFRRFSVAFNSFQLVPADCDDPAGMQEVAWAKHVALAQRLEKQFLGLTGIKPDVGVYRPNLACILHYPGTEKALAAEQLFRAGLTDQIFMIGDHIQDFLGDDPRLIHCAVNNASDEFKAKCQFLAQQPFTCGVLECLEWIGTSY